MEKAIDSGFDEMFCVPLKMVQIQTEILPSLIARREEINQKKMLMVDIKKQIASSDFVRSSSKMLPKLQLSYDVIEEEEKNVGIDSDSD